MTTLGGGPDPGYGTRASDSALCLLIVGGYEHNAETLDRVVREVRERVLMSPTLGDLFEFRFADLGPRADDAVAVARLVREFTSRPADAAHHFSGLIVFDKKASSVQRVLRDCQADGVLSALNIRCRGLAAEEDREPATDSDAGSQWPDVVVARAGALPFDELVEVVYSYAETLLDEFDSSAQSGLPAERLSALGSAAEPWVRDVMKSAAAEEEAAVKARIRKQQEAEELRRVEAKQQASADQQASAHQQASQRDSAAGPTAAARQNAQPGPDGDTASAIADGHAAGPADASSQRPGQSLVAFVQSGLSRVGNLLRQPATAPGAVNAAETILLECSARMRAADWNGVQACVSTLRAYSDAGMSDEQQSRCRAIILAEGLLQRGSAMGSGAVAFYDSLLRVGFGLPLDYQGFCEIEACFQRPGQPRHPPDGQLLEAISRGGTGDVRVLALAVYFLRGKWMATWFASGDADITKLIAALAGDWSEQLHADVVRDVTVHYLQEMRGRYKPTDVRTTLREYGYLARAFEARYPARSTQSALLTEFVAAAYPRGLDKKAVKAIFDASKLTVALAAVVLHLLASSGDSRWMIREYARRLGSHDIDKYQEKELLSILRRARQA